MNTFNLTLDLNKSRAANPVRIRQGDVQGTTITALILDHGATADLTGYTAQFVMDLPGGTHYYRKAASISGNTVTVTIDETQAASVTGRTTLAYVQLLRGSTVKASTGCVTVEVLPDALDGKTVPESYDSAIQDAIDALDAAVADMPDMVEDVLADHPEWTTTVQDGSITDAKLIQQGGILSRNARLMYRLANLLTHRTDEGTLAAISDAAKTPMAGLTVYGQSTQDGTPTPESPVPIVSVAPDSEGNISLWAWGFNQWDEVAEDGYISDTTGKNIGSNTAYLRSKGYIHVFPNTEYHFTCTNGRPAGKVYYYDADKAYLSFNEVTFGGNNKTTPANARYMRFWLNYPGSYNHDICINISDPARNGTYQPYTSTVTPIDLDGHELRSLPDGTRDELTVDARGHVVLTQRVGHVVLDGSESSWEQKSTNTSGKYSYTFPCGLPDGSSLAVDAVSNWTLCDRFPNASDVGLNNGTYTCHTGVSARRTASGQAIFYHTGESLADWKTWLASNPTTLDYKLATPVTHDLGTIDPVPLVGPDLTAQAIPTAPFALTYERDLNTTLARLESAIATLA